MTKKIIGTMLSLATITTLMVGCGGSSSSSTTTTTEEPTALTSGNTTSTGTASTTLDAKQIDAGVVTAPVAVTATTTDGTSTATATVATGTSFTDANGAALDNVTPKLAVTQDKGTETTATETTNIVQTEVALTDATGNKIIPSEGITVKVKAPSGAQPGDSVNVSIPTDASKATGQQKLLVFIVAADRTISVFLAPDVFKNETRILIIIEKIIPVTGATGATGS